MSRTTALSKEKKDYVRNEAPAPTVKSPPEERVDVTEEFNLPVRFTYVPVEGLAAGNAKAWEPRSGKTPAWEALRRLPKLSQWLTNNPLSVVYGRVNAKHELRVTSIYAGETWVPEVDARKMTPHFLWLDTREPTIDRESTYGVSDPTPATA